MIVAGASPGETKMWAAVLENGDFFTYHVRGSCQNEETYVRIFFHHRVAAPF